MVWFSKLGWLGLVGLIWQVWFGLVGLFGYVWFGRFGFSDDVDKAPLRFGLLGLVW